MTRQELLDRLPGYNEVHGHLMPNGELCLVLTHSATPDSDVFVRVRADEDVLDVWDPASDEPHERINQGGDW